MQNAKNLCKNSEIKPDEAQPSLVLLATSPISEYNPPKQYWHAGPIILYE